ncbi:MAG TPA: GntG family PLP-dependent aldolase [Chitinophagaceae bacterium]|nr:threonine aldolase [Chitinophagaceae bacterium]MCC6635290.1 threonine aldolase [Chitinophagaceae bacterium]HMZ46061.1 GntG family PLP-dependent aldolase [Chitinophagaceae bacterium]HNF29652.1 GntG family PLP-dependent aldolase [Chitinophagaceae bacterium]HNM34762.1 GntG family PLP-dependent aldolase [Chitinophagaceae bacterium]
MIDFRSDTVTKPTKQMLEAMLQAKVGDDVFGEDPTVNELEEYAANLFGIQAALFCPSGTMTNQIAIKVHTQPGDEIICDNLSHIYQYEGGGIAVNSACSVKLINGNYGKINAKQVAENINNINDVHKPISKLLSLENTSNRGGGSCYHFDDFIAIKEVCTQNNLMLHLDGARLFNAIIYKNESAKQYGKVFNSISICLSKGLGAPIGSLLLGDKNFILKARRVRKVFGGGMRQAGIIAAAGLYALQNNIQRLSTDHHHAQLIATALRQKSFVTNILPVETNIIIFEVAEKYTAKELIATLYKNNILAFAIAENQIRLVLHLGITTEMVEETIQLIQKL